MTRHGPGRAGRARRQAWRVIYVAVEQPDKRPSSAISSIDPTPRARQLRSSVNWASRVAMLTGDKVPRGRTTIADELGIKTVFAKVGTAGQKADKVKELQDQGKQ